MLYLDVPFAEKDEAKRLGARWDPSMKKWYVENRFDYPKFIKWILKDEAEVEIICDHVYLVVGTRKCYKCGQQIPVITFAVKKYCRLWDKEYFGTPNYFEWVDDDIKITSDMPEIWDIEEYKCFKEYLAEYYNYHVGYSRTAGCSYEANHCICCDSIQGDFYLNQEVDSPFFIDSPEKASKLWLYKIKLPYDKKMDLGINLSTAYWMIEEYANFEDFEFEWNLPG